MRRILWLVVLMLSGHGLKSETFSDRSSWRYGLGFGLNRSGDYAALEGVSPRLTTYDMADLRQSTALVASVGFHNIYNLKVEDSRFEESQVSLFTLGFENRVEISEGQQQVFSRVQVVNYSLRDKLFDDAFAMGFKLSVGMDFVLAENRKHLIGGDSTATFFLMGELQAGLPKTTRQTQEAEVLNGIFVTTGIRNHF